MSKLMSLLGAILLAVGLVTGLLELMRPGQMQGLGISIGTSVDLIIGGILAMGLGGVIAALARPALDYVTEAAPAPTADILVPGSTIGQPSVDVAPAPEVPALDETVAETPAPTRNRFGFGKKLGATTAVVAAGTAVAEAAAPVAEAASTNVQDTLDALEQAKQDIKGALGGIETVVAPAATPEAVVEAAPEAAPSEDELYVIEEKMIRGRPARILSDNTVEAETDEGWMRFENLEHLNEYLDASGE